MTTHDCKVKPCPFCDWDEWMKANPVIKGDITTVYQARIKELEAENRRLRDTLTDCRLWFEYTGLPFEDGNVDEAELYSKIQSVLSNQAALNPNPEPERGS